MYKYFKIILVLLLSFSLFSCTKTQESQPEEKPAEESEVKELKVESVSSLPDGDFQMEATFPDHLDYVDDTLALNSTISFYGYEDQGELFLRINKDLKSFDFYINSEGKHLEDVKKGDVYKVDFSDFAINGRNSLQISSLNGEDTEGCISAYVPYPIVIDGDLTSEGFHEHLLKRFCYAFFAVLLLRAFTPRLPRRFRGKRFTTRSRLTVDRAFSHHSTPLLFLMGVTI